jgi:hypothetical protein
VIDVRYSPERCATMARGCRNSERSKLARDAYGFAVRTLVKSGHVGLFRPHIRERAIYKKLVALPRAMDTRVAPGYWLHIVISASPTAFAVFLRRNRPWLEQQITSAAQT